MVAWLQARERSPSERSKVDEDICGLMCFDSNRRAAMHHREGVAYHCTSFICCMAMSRLTCHTLVWLFPQTQKTAFENHQRTQAELCRLLKV